MQNHPKYARALVALVFFLPLAVCAGIAKMDSKPVWDLADHGGPTPIGADKSVEIPNHLLADSYAFTIEAKYRFDDMTEQTIMSLLDCTVGETGFGAYCDTIRTSGKTVHLLCNGHTYGGCGCWFLAGLNSGRATWKPNGTELKLTISAHKGWLNVYQDDVLQNTYQMQVVPNLAPIRAGGEAYKRDKTKYPDMKGVTLLSLKLWDGLEEYRGKGEPEKKSTYFATGKGWQVRVPTEPVKGAPNIFYYGASISCGYTPRLTELTKGKANLYHWMSWISDPGKEGVDTKKFVEIGKLADYDYVFFCAGGHTLRWADRGISDDRVRESYRALLAAFRQMAPHAKKFVYLLITPHTPIEGATPERNAKWLADNKTIVRYNALAREVMEAEGVKVLDFHTLFSQRRDFWCADGSHFLEPAYRVMAEAIAAEVLPQE